MNKELFKSARKAFFVDKKAEEALELIAPLLAEKSKLSVADQRGIFELAALAHQSNSKYEEAARLFLSIQDYYQGGYCYMLLNDLERAAEQWKKVLVIRQNHWCLTLYGMITGNLNSYPTFLQIRNHLESDIIHLSRAAQLMMLMNLQKYLDTLAEINYETYKFAGRAYFNAGNMDQAGRLLMKAQKILPNDPEIYFHLGQYYNEKGNSDDSALMLQQCLLISPTYMPSKDLLKTIQQRIQRG